MMNVAVGNECEKLYELYQELKYLQSLIKYILQWELEIYLLRSEWYISNKTFGITFQIINLLIVTMY